MQEKVFISFVEEDFEIAKEIKNRLLEEGIGSWIYTEDNEIGDYRDGIMKAISDSEIMILVFSRQTENSPHIPKELREASEKNLTIIPFFIEKIDYIENPSIRYEIGTINWIHGWEPPIEEQISKLIDETKSVLNNTAEIKNNIKDTSQAKYSNHKLIKDVSKKNLLISILVVLSIISGAIGYLILKSEPQTLNHIRVVTSEKNSQASYYIQVGTFSQEPSKRFLSIITKNGFDYKFYKFNHNGEMMRKLLIGPYGSRKEARRDLQKVENSINKNAFITEL